MIKNLINFQLSSEIYYVDHKIQRVQFRVYTHTHYKL